MFDTQCMKGKTALITGASSGLGRHFAKTLSHHGAVVIVAARRVEKLNSLVDDIRSTGAKAIALSLDVSDENSTKAAFDYLSRHHDTINVLINNAGIADSKRFLNVDEDSWSTVLNTNLTGAWRVARLFSQQLVAHNQSGSIVNIASILGLRVSIGESTYATTKAALVQLTKSMALELVSKNIRVNALCPGYFATELNQDYFDSARGQQYIQSTPAKRVGQLDELNGPLLLLSSDAGSFINGVALPVDGCHLNSAL